jgi:hypothetical protein
MKRLFSGRSMIVPLPLCSCHPESVPEDLTVSFSVFDHREQIGVNKTAITRVHTTVTQYFLSLTPETVFFHNSGHKKMKFMFQIFSSDSYV